MKSVMVIPSYWSRKQNIGWKQGDAIYDHPTPLDKSGTLGRLLESITILDESSFDLVILAVPTTEEIEQEVEEKVRHITQSANLTMNICVVGPTQIKKIQQYFIKQGKQTYTDLVNIRGYSNVRNLCLFLPAMMDADIAILIDDDEVFTDANYIVKAIEHYNKPIEKNRCYGIAGYYINADGSYQVEKPNSEWMKHWNKTQAMNEGFKKIIGSKPRVKQTPFVFGGNMIIPKQLYQSIPFDPNVPRGEDIDYLLNARMFGYHFYLDNSLHITHLPPKKSHETWQRLREDIYRFIYERTKINGQQPTKEMHHVHAEDFDPYPGQFLKDDLEEKIRKSNTLLSEAYLSEGKTRQSREALKNIEIANTDAIPSFDPFQTYCQLQKTWEQLMKYIQSTSVRQDLINILAS